MAKHGNWGQQILEQVQARAKALGVIPADQPPLPRLPQVVHAEGWVTFTIPGKPRTKKNSQRIIRIGKFAKIIPSAAHQAWFKVALPALRLQAPPVPITQDVSCSAIFYRDRLTGDLSNYIAALSDLLQAAGVIADDKQIHSYDGCRLSKDAANPRIVVTIRPFEK